jgi:ribosome biogenesis GTPase / thiamine phosphate phosphatase
MPRPDRVANALYEQHMNGLSVYGWNAFFEDAFRAYAGEGDEVARITAEHRGGYVLATARGELKGQLSGKLRRAVAHRSAPHPSVGDWVVIATSEREKHGYAVMHALLSRRTTLARKVAGRAVAEQVIAANVDVVLVVCALAHEVNARSLERYLTLARESGATPVVVLTKADLCENLAGARDAVIALARGVSVHTVSSRSGDGVRELMALFQNDGTVAVIGPSGVGKSTLVNAWLGDDAQAVREIRGDGKGRHTTTHRHLFVMPAGGLVIDTPGMREIALWDVDEGLRDTFDDIEVLAADCRFRDCGHGAEPGCAITLAVSAGTLEAARLASFQRLLRESAKLHEVRADSASATTKARSGAVSRVVPPRRRRP